MEMISDEMLAQELQRRKNLLKKRPIMKKVPNIEEIRKTLISVMDDIEQRKYDDEDNRAWFEEAVIKAFFDDASLYYKWVRRITEDA